MISSNIIITTPSSNRSSKNVGVNYTKFSDEALSILHPANKLPDTHLPRRSTETKKCLRRDRKCALNHWLHGYKIPFLIISLLGLFFGFILYFSLENPHPGTWITTDCLSLSSSYYSPCREDYKCSICKIQVSLEVDSLTHFPGNKQELTLNMVTTSSEIDCLQTIYAPGASFLCYYPLRDDIDMIQEAIVPKHIAEEKRAIYHSQLRGGRTVLILSILGVFSFLMLGFLKYLCGPLHESYPSLKYFYPRVWCHYLLQKCCIRKEIVSDTFVMKKSSKYLETQHGVDQTGQSLSLGLNIPENVSKLRQDRIYSDQVTGTKFKLEGITTLPQTVISSQSKSTYIPPDPLYESNMYNQPSQSPNSIRETETVPYSGSFSGTYLGSIHINSHQ